MPLAPVDGIIAPEPLLVPEEASVDAGAEPLTVSSVFLLQAPSIKAAAKHSAAVVAIFIFVSYISVTFFVRTYSGKRFKHGHRRSLYFAGFGGRRKRHHGLGGRDIWIGSHIDTFTQ